VACVYVEVRFAFRLAEFVFLLFSLFCSNIVHEMWLRCAVKVKLSICLTKYHATKTYEAVEV
jgi:hypothetical protein